MKWGFLDAVKQLSAMIDELATAIFLEDEELFLEQSEEFSKLVRSSEYRELPLIVGVEVKDLEQELQKLRTLND